MERQPPRSTESSIGMQMKLEGQRGSYPEELCIRFVNTVAWRLRDPQEDRLSSSEALLDWFVANGLCERRRLYRLQAGWRSDVGRRADFHAAALELREAIYHILRALIAEGRPPREALKLLNAWLARPSPGLELTPVDGALGWRPSVTAQDPCDMLKSIAVSAAGLMTGPRADNVRQCSDDRGCGWLFVDESRAQNRRWCAMGDCGNRAKAARHRARRRNASA